MFEVFHNRELNQIFDHSLNILHTTKDDFPLSTSCKEESKIYNQSYGYIVCMFFTNTLREDLHKLSMS